MLSSRSSLVVALALAIAVAGTPAAVRAQSLTSGSLRGSIVTRDGTPVAGAQVALEASDGATLRVLETNRNGEFTVTLLAPGSYRLLVEQVGFQPLRRLGVTVRAGQATSVSVAIERRPPPITSVVEVEGPSPSAGYAGGRLVAGRELREFDARREVTDAGRGTTELVTAHDGRDGLALAGLGNVPGASRLFVDGVPEPLLRHPGVPGAPASAPLFSRDAVAQAQILQTGADAEWRGVPGSIFSAETRRGTNRVTFAPWGRVTNAKLGGNADLNPADSSGMSFGVGAVVSGALVPDTAHFLLRGEYHSIETPTAYSFEGDDVLRQAIAGVGADFGSPLAASVNPVVRTWKGGNASGRLDWQVAPRHAVMLRAGFAKWKEEQPELVRDAGNEAGAALDARDFSGAVTVTSTGESQANEFRAGFGVARRDWTASGRPATILAHEGVRVGGSALLPGLFDQKSLAIGDAFQFTLSRHAIKVGATLDYTSHEQNWSHGSAGVFLFGDVDDFALAEGTWFRTQGASAGAKFSTTDVGLFAEDSYAAAPDLQLLFGVRYETQSLPANKLPLNQEWLDASGLRTDARPADRSGFGPRVGLVWDVQNRGEWIVRGGGGYFHSGIDPARFAEAVMGGNGLSAVRAQGALDWPVPPGGSLSDPAPRLALFTDQYKAPRTFKAEVGITRAVSNGMTFQLTGGYYHTDYQLRRTNLNRVPAPVAETDEGRPVFGALVKQAGLLQAETGSNRRFEEFDLVSGLVPTGFTDHYEVTASLERRVLRDLSLLASYTFSRTRDNLVGRLEADPYDQLSPFPGGLAGADWDEGRSDLDVPHRAAATLEYRSAGRAPLTLSARWRWRSGLPFTPGFRPGVDANADGGGNNDPAFLDAGLNSLPALLANGSCSQTAANQFAERNGCREKAVQSLDLGLKVLLPFGSAASRLALHLDALNVVASTTGVVDRALVLVDPGVTLGTAAGVYSLPLIANPNFGAILARRGEPRLVRVGLGIEY